MFLQCSGHFVINGWVQCCTSMRLWSPDKLKQPQPFMATSVTGSQDKNRQFRDTKEAATLVVGSWKPGGRSACNGVSLSHYCRGRRGGELPRLPSPQQQRPPVCSCSRPMALPEARNAPLWPPGASPAGQVMSREQRSDWT